MVGDCICLKKLEVFLNLASMDMWNAGQGGCLLEQKRVDLEGIGQDM